MLLRGQMLPRCPNTLSVIAHITPPIISALAAYSGLGFHPGLFNGPQYCTTHTHTHEHGEHERKRESFHALCQVGCLYVANAPIYLCIKIMPTDIISVVCLCCKFIEPQLHVNAVTMLSLLLYEYNVRLTQWHICLFPSCAKREIRRQKPLTSEVHRNILGRYLHTFCIITATLPLFVEHIMPNISFYHL